jgi:hypothetical protein
MSDKIAIVKVATKFAAGFGVSKVISDIIKTNTVVQTTADAVKVWTGSLVLGTLITDVSMKYVEEQIDSLQTWIEKRQENEEEVKETPKSRARKTAS